MPAEAGCGEPSQQVSTFRWQRSHHNPLWRRTAEGSVARWAGVHAVEYCTGSGRRPGPNEGGGLPARGGRSTLPRDGRRGVRGCPSGGDPLPCGNGATASGAGGASVRSAVRTFLLASLAALGALVGGGVLVLREVGEDEAVDEARRTALLTGQGIVEPALTDAVLAGRGPAVERVDRLVTERVLDDRVVRVKLWTPEGRIVYSDEPRLIGPATRWGRTSGPPCGRAPRRPRRAT